MSVSKLIEYMHKEFDKEGVAKKCFEKGFNDPESKYYQMDVNAILESWEAKATESKKYGSKSEFKKNSSGAYDYARQHNLLKEMTWLKRPKKYGYNR